MATPPSTVPSWDDNNSRSTAPPTQIQDDGLPETSLLPNVYLNWVLRWLCAWAQLLNTLGIAKFDQEHYTTGLHKTINADDVYTDRGGSTAVKVGGLYDVTLSDGAELTNSTTETVLHATTLVAADVQAGSVFRMRGVVYLTQHTTGTLTIRGRIGGVSGGTLFSSAAPSPSSGQYAIVDLVLTCLVNDASGVYTSHTIITWDDGTTVTVDTGRVNASALDTTVDQDLVLTGQWGTADAGNRVEATNGITVEAA